MNLQNLYTSTAANFLIQQFTDILLITDHNGIILNHNHIAESLFDPSPLKGMATNDILQLKDSEGNIIECPVLKCLNENQRIEIKEPSLWVQKNKLVTFKAIPILLEQKVKGCLMIIKDIDQIEKLKSKSKEDQQIFSILFENAPFGIAVIDTKGNVLEVNSFMIKILGSPSKEATQSINILNHRPLQESPLVENINLVINTQKTVSNTAKYITKWGKLIYVYYQLVPIIQDNKLHHIFLYVNDLTPVYEAQEREMLIKNQISLLHQFSYEFITLDNYFNPYVFIGEKVKMLFPDCSIGINKYHFDKNYFSTEYIYSPQSYFQEFILQLQKQQRTLTYTLSPDLWPINFEGKLIQIPKDDFFTVNFSISKENVVDLILNANVKNIYTMGFISNSMLLGNITIFTHKEEANIEILEVFINQASLLLQRHINQKKINENHAFYRSILNSVDNFIFVLDKNNKILFCNNPLLRFLSEHNFPTSILGTEILTAIPFLNPKVLAYLEEAKKTKSNQFFKISTHINQHTIYFQTSITLLPKDDENDEYILTLKDITSLTLSEKEIESLTQINEKIITNLNEGIMLIDKQMRVKFLNPAFLSFFEFNPNLDYKNHIFTEFLPFPFKEKAIEIVNHIFSSPTYLKFEFKFKNSKNEEHFFRKELFPIVEDNQTQFIFILFSDITDQKRKEISLIESKEKAEYNNQLKSTFIASISHEIRNPLNAINGFANLLLKSNINDDKKNLYVKQINASSLTLSRLIDDLIDYTKIETGHFKLIYENIFVYPLLEELYEQYKQELIVKNKENIALVLDNSADDDFVFYTDKLRLKQILSNLLINAVKYTYEGEIHFGFQPYNSSIIFYVKDTGIGIKEEDIPFIFNPFKQLVKKYTNEQKGSGLGLAIVKNLTELLHGTVHVESAWQKGSTFSVRLPYEISLETKNSTIETQSVINFKTPLTILIAEDDEINFMFLEEMLSELKFKIIHASNGKKAVELFIQHRDEIDLVLMDIQMPIMDGFTATQKIKEIQPQIPIIAQTAYAYSTEIELSRKAGCSDYIVKPIQQDILIQKINQFISHKNNL